MTPSPARPAPPRAERIRGPGELLRAVPYLLGFHPTESLVLVGLRPDRTLLVTARLDLADVFASGPDGTGLLTHTLIRLTEGGAATILPVVYSRTATVTDTHREQAGLLLHAAAAARCRLADVLLVGGTRWWHPGCDDARCCDPAGSELPAVATSFVTAATVDGIVPLPDRAALTALLDAAPDEDRTAMLPLLSAVAGARPKRPGELVSMARASAAHGWSPPRGRTLASAAHALRRVALRDPVWLAIDAGEVDGRPLWRELLRRMPSPWDAAPSFLYGWASWRAGNGALARIAAERAVTSDPAYSAADLLLAILTHGVDPHTFPPLRRSA